MTLKLPRFIRRITTVWVWAALLHALKEATCWVLKGHTVPQWQRYRVVRTQSLNDTLEINFFHLARVESIERIKLRSSSRLNPLSLMHTPKSFSRSMPMVYQAAASQFRVYFSLLCSSSAQCTSRRRRLQQVKEQDIKGLKSMAYQQQPLHENSVRSPSLLSATTGTTAGNDSLTLLKHVS